MPQDVTVAIRADTAPFEQALGNLSKLSSSFGIQLTGALKGAVASGKDLDDVLRKIGLSLAGTALQQGLAPLQALAGSPLPGLFGSIGAAMPFAKRGVVPFASGGVVSSWWVIWDYVKGEQ